MQTLAQNLPSGSTHINWKADIDLPEGTIELRDETGRVLGRIENIGKDPAPVEPRFAIALRVKELEKELVMANAILEAVESALEGEDVSDFMESFQLVATAKQCYAFAQQSRQRVWTGPGELERTGYIDPETPHA